MSVQGTTVWGMTSVATTDTRTTHTFPSPVGDITLWLEGNALARLTIHDGPAAAAATTPEHPVLADIVAQLAEYFAGHRQSFDVPLALRGTTFQEDIWNTLVDIPYGHTRSYGELGARAGHPGSARAVGGAVGANPVPIIVPCHRVMGKDGAITGYSGGSGIPTKQWLLRMEQAA